MPSLARRQTSTSPVVAPSPPTSVRTARLYLGRSEAPFRTCPAGVRSGGRDGDLRRSVGGDGLRVGPVRARRRRSRTRQPPRIPTVQRSVLAVCLLLSLTALAAAVVALLRAPDAPLSRAPTRFDAEVRLPHPLSELRGLMSQGDVRALLGAPKGVFRDSERAQCWVYSTPYKVRMCFGPKRQLAWWATDAPLEPFAKRFPKPS